MHENSYISPDGQWLWNGTEWVPNVTGYAASVDPRLTPPTYAGAGRPAKSGLSRGKKIGLGLGGTVLALAVIGALSPDAQPIEAAAPAPSASATSEPSDEPTDEATPAGMPADEADFLATVEGSREEINSTDNELKQAKALRDRDRDLARILGTGLKADDWTGTITDIGANGEGKGYVEVELTSGVRITTWNNALSDIGDNTLIPESSPMYDNLLELEEGDVVVVSGKFFSGSDTALRGTNLTDTFYGIDPKFLFKFSSLAAA